MKAIILAAGLGKRLKLSSIPKPMYKVNGKPILEHNILLLKKHGVEDICINLHFMPEIIKSYFGDGSKFGVNIQYSYEEELLGTSGAVKNVEWFVTGERFFVLYGDNYTRIELGDMLNFHLSCKPSCTIAVFDPHNSVSSGIAGSIITMDADNKLVSFREGVREGIKGYVNAGVYILESEVLSVIPSNVFCDFGSSTFPKLIMKKMLVKCYLTKSFILAIDTKEAMEEANRLIERGAVKDDYY